MKKYLLCGLISLVLVCGCAIDVNTFELHPCSLTAEELEKICDYKTDCVKKIKEACEDI